MHVGRPQSEAGLCLSRHLYFVEYLGDDFVGGDVIGFSLVGDTDTVAEHIVADGYDIFGDHETSLVQERICAGCTCEADRCSRRRTESDYAGETI